MRKLFPGHYSPTKEEFDTIWKDGIFVFDANVLLDLYRYSEKTVQSLIQVMESINSRIWIPFQVSKEYHNNLNNVISDQVKKYENTIKTLTEFKKQIDEKRSHPFLSEELTEEIDSFCKKFDKELLEKKEIIKQLILNNPIKEKIADLTENKIGSKFSNKELEDIYKEGESRYANKIPPGFGDKNKSIPDKYGDLIFWKEILNKNAAITTPILLITGDKKEDWFLTELGLTIGPRPELIEEFKNVKNNLFYIYPTDVFLKLAQEYLKMDITEDAIKEVGGFILDNTKQIHIESTEKESSHNESDISGDLDNQDSNSEESTNFGDNEDNSQVEETESI